MAGLLDKKRERSSEGEIPTSSMADIAFLLLIFFLVTTTIDVDTGIGMTLPPPLDENVEPPPVKERNILKILIGPNGEVQIEGEASSVNQVREEVKRQVLNNGQDPAYAESSEDAVISIKTSSQTPYSAYIAAVDETWMAYREIWDEEARQLGFPSYDAYRTSRPPGEDKNPIREKIGANISIAEPDEEGSEGGSVGAAGG